MICASPVQRVENERLRDENKALKAENAKLREQGARLFDKTLELGTENAKLFALLKHESEQVEKLRELMRDTVMDVKDYAEKYGIAPHFTDVNKHLDDRMRELGIEVTT